MIQVDHNLFEFFISLFQDHQPPVSARLTRENLLNQCEDGDHLTVLSTQAKRRRVNSNNPVRTSQVCRIPVRLRLYFYFLGSISRNVFNFHIFNCLFVSSSNFNFSVLGFEKQFYSMKCLHSNFFVELIKFISRFEGNSRFLEFVYTIQSFQQ